MALPSLTVVIPTYNRSRLLARTLGSLAAQEGAPSFEVVVADDGSSDDTAEVAAAFGDRLAVEYAFQPDEGFRAGQARNLGARLARAPVLVFLDTGHVAGPGFLHAYQSAFMRGGGAGRGLVVIGYNYGYNRFDDTGSADLAALLDEHGPTEAVRRRGRDDAFRDMRHGRFEQFGPELTGHPAPWWLCWSGNIAVDRGTFRSLGGFDEDFRAWGMEDVELGFRLVAHGARVTVRTDAWTVDYPHPRSVESEIASNAGNGRLFLDKHPEPVPELLWARLTHYPRVRFEAVCAEFQEWSRAAPTDVRDEVAAMVAKAEPAPGARIAVVGCGAALPDALPPSCTVMDFDADLLAAATADARHTGRWAIGLQTRCADGEFDLVLVTSRLSGLWERWGGALTAEAHRIGHRCISATA